MTESKAASAQIDQGVSPAQDGLPFLADGTSSSGWKNLWRMVSGSMSPEGKREYWLERDKREEGLNDAWAERQRDYLLQYSPVIRFLNDKISELGGRLDRDNIRCTRCVSHLAGGGFSPELGIRICSNEVKNPKELEDTLAHEMVHAYDHLRYKVDWENNIRHAACSEIRASSLSGECRWRREMYDRSIWKYTMQHQECVRRRAILSVSRRDFCKDEAQAAKVVDAVWDSCFRDTRPFDEIYR